MSFFLEKKDCVGLSVLPQIISPDSKTRLVSTVGAQSVFANGRLIRVMGCEHFHSLSSPFPLLSSSVEMGWQPSGRIPFTLLEKDCTLQGACGSGAGRSWVDNHLFCRIATVWRRSIYPQLFPFKLISKATGLVSSCCACQGWL